MDARKKRAIALIILLCACAIVYLPFAVPGLLTLSLRRSFPGSTVSVGTCSVKPSGEIIIEDIAVNGTGLYEISAEEIRIKLAIIPLLRARIPRIVVREPIVLVTLGTKDIRTLTKSIPQGAGGLIKVEQIEVFRAHLEVTSGNFITEAFISAAYLPVQKKIEKLDVSVDYLRYPGLLVKGFALYAQQGRSDGRLYARRLMYNRVQAYETEGVLLLKDTTMTVDSLRAQLFGGTVRGGLSITLEPPFAYSGQCVLEDADFSRLIDELGFQKKIMATGRLNGKFSLNGSSTQLAAVRGQLSARGPRGSFVIKDEPLLRSIADTRKQDFQGIMNAFKAYSYTKGTVSLSSQEDTLGLQVYLDGQQGKRDLAINVHNFFSPVAHDRKN